MKHSFKDDMNIFAHLFSLDKWIRSGSLKNVFHTTKWRLLTLHLTPEVSVSILPRGIL